MNNIVSTITNAISNVYSTVTNLLGQVFKSKKVNVSLGTFLIEIFIVIRPEFESHRDVLMTLVAVLGTSNVFAFAVQDAAIAIRTGTSKYQPKSF